MLNDSDAVYAVVLCTLSRTFRFKLVCTSIENCSDLMRQQFNVEYVLLYIPVYEQESLYYTYVYELYGVCSHKESMAVYITLSDSILLL